MHGEYINLKIINHEEGLDDLTISKSIQYIANADVLIIGGTSLAVWPAAGLIDYYRGDKLVLINKSQTARETRANLVIEGKIGEVLGSL